MSGEKWLFIQADDLEVGLHVAIHSWKDGRPHWLGISLDIKAINLPYLIVTQEEWPSATLDARLVNLIQVTPEIVAAQLSH